MRERLTDNPKYFFPFLSRGWYHSLGNGQYSVENPWKVLDEDLSHTGMLVLEQTYEELNDVHFNVLEADPVFTNGTI